MTDCEQAPGPIGVWRRIEHDLWVGHLGTRCLGTIEHGRRFTWIDPEGRPHVGQDTLAAAQVASVSAGAVPAAAERGQWLWDASFWVLIAAALLMAAVVAAVLVA